MRQSVRSIARDMRFVSFPPLLLSHSSTSCTSPTMATTSVEPCFRRLDIVPVEVFETIMAFSLVPTRFDEDDHEEKETKDVPPEKRIA